MERILWWLLFCLMPAALPLTAQEKPVEAVPNSDVDSSATLLDIYLTLDHKSKPAEHASADLESMPLAQKPQRVNGSDRKTTEAVYPERVAQEQGQQILASENSFSNLMDRPKSLERPTENHSSERMETGKTWPAGTPQTTLVDVSRPKAELSEQEALNLGMDKDPLDIFLEAYDVLLQDSESEPPKKLAQETGPTPSQETSFATWDVEPDETVVPDQILTAAEKLQSQPDTKKHSDVVTETSPPAELDGSIEALPAGDNVEAVVETASPGPDQPIIITGELPNQYFPIEPLFEPMVSVDPSTVAAVQPDIDRGSVDQEQASQESLVSTGHQPIIVTGELPTIYFPVQPLFEPMVSVAPSTVATVQADVDRGSVDQERASQESLVSTDYKNLTRDEPIELPSPSAADWVAPVLSPHGSVASCDQPVCDQPVGIGGPLRGKRNSRKTFFDVELKLDLHPRESCTNGCESGSCWYGLRCPEVYYAIFGGPTSVTDLVDTARLGNVETQATYTYGDAFSLGVAVGQIRGLHLRTEVEFAFRSNNAETLDLMQNGQTFNYPLEGEINSFAGMANAYWEFVGFPMKQVKPYIGGGLGFSLFDSELTFLGEELLDSAFETDSAFAYQAMAGLNWCTGPNMSLFLEYRYFATDSIRYKVEDLLTQFEYKTDNVFIGVRFKY